MCLMPTRPVSSDTEKNSLVRRKVLAGGLEKLGGMQQAATAALSSAPRIVGPSVAEYALRVEIGVEGIGSDDRVHVRADGHPGLRVVSEYGAPQIARITPDGLTGLVLMGGDSHSGKEGGDGVGHPALVP